MFRRVLVADDNEDAADTIALLLETQGCVVCAVYDGAAALTAAQSFRPDLVLIDLAMPRISGLEVCRRIRAEEWGAGLTLVALTGLGQEQDHRLTTDAGFDLHLLKPVDPEVLLRLVRAGSL